MLVAATAVSFANAWPDAVALDDKFFVNNEHLPDWSEPSELFRGDVWRTIGAESGLYRPALLLSLSLDSKLFGGWLPGYHLSNILLHLLVTLALYGFLHQLLRTAPHAVPRPDLYALLAALVFAVHPVHTEAVNSVFNRSDMLVSLGAVAGLWWLLYCIESRPARAWAGLGVTYLLALLSKENAVVIPGLAVALLLFLPAENWRRRVRRSIPVLWMLLPLGLYLYLRAHALVSGAGDAVAEGGQGLGRVAEMAGGLHVISPNELLDLVGKWGTGLRLMVWPHPLQINYPAPPGAVSAGFAAAQLALIAAGFLQLRRGRSVLLTGLVWFYLALLPASRLVAIAGASPQLAERYLYLPSVGTAIMLTFALAWLGNRFGRPRAVLLTLLAVAVLMPLTWLRNHEWASDVRLFEAEYHRSGTHAETLRFLTGAHIRVGNFSRGAEICDRHPEEIEEHARVARHCGMLYARLGRSEDAERAYLQALARKGNPTISSDLAMLYLSMGRRLDAVIRFREAVELERRAAAKAMRQGLLLAHLYPGDAESLAQARNHFEEAYRLEPLLGAAKVWAERMSKALEILETREPDATRPENTRPQQ